MGVNTNTIADIHYIKTTELNHFTRLNKYTMHLQILNKWFLNCNKNELL